MRGQIQDWRVGLEGVTIRLTRRTFTGEAYNNAEQGRGRHEAQTMKWAFSLILSLWLSYIKENGWTMGQGAAAVLFLVPVLIVDSGKVKLSQSRVNYVSNRSQEMGYRLLVSWLIGKEEKKKRTYQLSILEDPNGSSTLYQYYESKMRYEEGWNMNMRNRRWCEKY